MKLFRWSKNIAGKDRYVLTITGLIIVIIIAWVLGSIFMPKNTADKLSNTNLEGIWVNTTDSGFIKFEVKSSGYFYFNNVALTGKTVVHKGVITNVSKDSMILVSFNNDTLLYHKIIALNKQGIQLKSIKDSSEIIFKKE